MAATVPTWEPLPASLCLPDGEVHLWRAALRLPEARLAEMSRLLSKDERQRADRFHRRAHQQPFVAARGMLRLLLGRYLEAAPEQLEFSYGPHGKPALAGLYGRSGLRFNLSHSNWLALCAVARQREVGVDVEYMERPVHHEQIARRFFSPEEVEALKRLPPEKRKEGFFNAWTRKEAYLKALGQGITAGLDSFSVSLGPGQEAALLKSSEGTAEVGRWQLQALSPAPGYAAALCAEGRDWRLRCFHWKG